MLIGGVTQDFQIFVKHFKIHILGIVRNHSHDCIFIEKPTQVVDMSVGVVTLESTF